MLRRPSLHLFVFAHPDGAQTEDGDLPGVPVRQAVEGENLVHLAISPGIPSAAVIAIF